MILHFLISVLCWIAVQPSEDSIRSQVQHSLFLTFHVFAFNLCIFLSVHQFTALLLLQVRDSKFEWNRLIGLIWLSEIFLILFLPLYLFLLPSLLALCTIPPFLYFLISILLFLGLILGSGFWVIVSLHFYFLSCQIHLIFHLFFPQAKFHKLFDFLLTVHLSLSFLFLVLKICCASFIIVHQDWLQPILLKFLQHRI